LTVKEVKERPAKEQDLPSDRFRLYFGGKEFDKTRIMADYNVGRGSEVHMVLKRKDG
jgi:hypothetical protein